MYHLFVKILSISKFIFNIFHNSTNLLDHLVQEPGRLDFLFKPFLHITERQLFPGARHSDVEHPPLLLDRLRKDCFLIRHYALVDVKKIDLVVLESLDAVQGGNHNSFRTLCALLLFFLHLLLVFLNMCKPALDAFLALCRLLQLVQNGNQIILFQMSVCSIFLHILFIADRIADVIDRAERR